MISKFVAVLSILFCLKSYAIEPRIEPLMALKVDKTGVSIRVESGGCTDKTSFQIKRSLTRDGAGQRLTFVRAEEDSCLALLRSGVLLSFSWQDLRLPVGALVKIENPIKCR